MERWHVTSGQILFTLALCWCVPLWACPPDCNGQCLAGAQAAGPSCPSVGCLCKNLGWTTIPPMVNTSVIHSLILTGNRLTGALQNDTFQKLGNLTVLALDNCSIGAALEPSTFRPLHKLQIFDLSGNGLVDLDADILRGLTNLQRLDLSSNLISRLPDDAFRGLVKLGILDLSRNNISELRPEIFLGLESLFALFLRWNFLTTIPANLFQNLVGLQAISLSHNLIYHYDPAALNGTRVHNLDLSHNLIGHLPATFTSWTPALMGLDLSGNALTTLNQSQFVPGPHLRVIQLSGMLQLTAVLPGAFGELPSLEQVNVSGSPQLGYFSAEAFRGSSPLRTLDLSGCGLQSLRAGLLRTLTSGMQLRLDGNPWWCNCSLHWLADVRAARPSLFDEAADNVLCLRPEGRAGRSVFDLDNYLVNCSKATVAFYTPLVSFRIDSTALLECQVEGDPPPGITWSTPKNSEFHWYPEEKELAALQQADVGAESTASGRRVRVLKNGNLFISHVRIEDAGIYTCLADNSLGKQSASIRMILDYEILVQVKVVSILVGLATSVAFLLTMLVAQLVHMILNRWGWCCCRGKLPPKAKKVRKMLESIEHYKTQQLDRLRENYNMQVQRIKDNGTQQMEWLRESYYSQTDKLGAIRDYGTLQIDRMRDQYYDQVRRVRDYSVQQMSKVRENYVSQRNRIRKFSAHQLFKLRENYKVQQMHLNKILENLNLESCRTVCARTDSVMFTSDLTIDPSFVQGRLPKPIRLDGSPGSGDSEFDDVRDVELGHIRLNDFELRPLSRDAEEEKGMPPLTLPVLLLHGDLPSVQGAGPDTGEDQEAVPAERQDEVWVLMGSTSQESEPQTGNTVTV